MSKCRPNFLTREECEVESAVTGLKMSCFPYKHSTLQASLWQVGHCTTKCQIMSNYYILALRHNYIRDLKVQWFMDEFCAQGVSERWSVAEAATGNLLYSQVCHLRAPLQPLVLTRFIQTIAALCCKPNNELRSSTQQRFGLRQTCRF